MASYKKKFAGKHVVITGGSEGIGLALAKLFVEAHANVTIVSRSASKLEAARSDLETSAQKCSSASLVNVQSADVTSYEQVVQICMAIFTSMASMYFNSRSTSTTWEPSTRSRLRMTAWSHGIAATSALSHPRWASWVSAAFQALVCSRGSISMRCQRPCFHIPLKLSRAVLWVETNLVLPNFSLGPAFVGYAAYCGSKYAVRGFAEALRNELCGSEVTVSIMFPPDTATPGYEQENKIKPKEATEISAGAIEVSPEAVARCMIKGIAGGRFMLGNPDLGLAIHQRAVAGMTPRRFPGILLDMLLGLFAPIVHMIFSKSMDNTSKKNAQTRFKKLWASDSK
eukprot:360002-Chlamydomonas_euryale.AAC.9